MIAGVCNNERTKACLAAVSSRLGALSESAVRELEAELKPVLEELLTRRTDTPLVLSAQLLAARLGLQQVDAATVRARFTARNESETIRLQALDALIAFRDPQLLSALAEVLSSASPEFVRHVLAMLGRLEDPNLADVVLGGYATLAPELQPLAIDLIMQRERWARKLLDAVLANRLPKGVLNANYLRKILESNDREALWAVEKAFGRVRDERDRQCEQQRAAWCNVERPFGREVFGIAVFDHPANPNHPSGWRADEQGLINPNVSALSDWTLGAQQTQQFRYRLLVYRGSATREQLARRFAELRRSELR